MPFDLLGLVAVVTQSIMKVFGRGDSTTNLEDPSWSGDVTRRESPPSV